MEVERTIILMEIDRRILMEVGRTIILMEVEKIH